MTKVLNLGFPGRGNIWRADLDFFFRLAITPDLFEIFLESAATAAVSACPRQGQTALFTQRTNTRSDASRYDSAPTGNTYD